MSNSSSSLTSDMTYVQTQPYSYGASTNTVGLTYIIPAPEWGKKPKKPKPKTLTDPMEWLRARVGEIVEYGAMA